MRSKTEELLETASERDLNIANRRLSQITAFLQDREPGDDTLPPLRTRQRWAAAYRGAELNLGSGYLGLIPQPRRGNCNPKLPDESRTLMAEFISSDYESLKQKTRYASWMALSLASEEKGIICPSYKTFCLAVRHRPGFEQTLKRQGPRAAYQQEPFYWQLEFRTPPHGDRPFEIAHIDHTELDVESVCSRTGRGLGRTWLTLLTDAFSRRILALYLTFDSPSYRSCMMVLRECVRRHSRLPQIIVVDGGREFQSTYFETLLARFELVKKTRPPAKPRFGSVCERLFGTANTQFLHNLQGNTQLTVKVRQVTQSVNPKGQAIWSFEALSQRITEYAYEVYDTCSHPALAASPRETYQAGFLRTGMRTHRQIPYDREFLILTLPTTPKGTAKVIPGKGIQINYLYYWSDLFRNPEVEKQNIPVRYDPFDAGTAHGFVNGQWTECHSEHYMIFRDRTEKDTMLASQELRRIRQCHSQQFKVTATKLAEFLESVESEEALLKQGSGTRIPPASDNSLHLVRTYTTAAASATCRCPSNPHGAIPTCLRSVLNMEAVFPATHWAQRLPEPIAAFRSFTMAHPRLLQAKEDLLNAIEASDPGSLILVVGPTGVGKTTLRKRVEESLAEKMAASMEIDPGQLPFVSLEAVAPDDGSFHWRDHYQRMLTQMNEPLIDHKLGLLRGEGERKRNGQYAPWPRGFTGYQLQQSVENALRYRRPAAVFIDEAQHLGRMAWGGRGRISWM